MSCSRYHPGLRRCSTTCLLILLATLFQAPCSAVTTIAWQQPSALASPGDRRTRLLYFHAEWCSWCRRFEKETLNNPEVAEIISRTFLPVLADSDFEPTLFRRYGGRGLPYVVLVAPEGTALGSFTGILGAGPFLEWLEERSRQETATEVAVNPRLFHETLEELWDDADARFQGVSFNGIQGSKRPQPLVALYLLERCFAPSGRATPVHPCPGPAWPERLPRLLDHMLEELEDPVEGGFYFYADPTGEAHTETAKRLERNLRMAWLYLEACRRLDRPGYCRVVRRTLTYLNRTLWKEEAGAYMAGQHSDADYFDLPLEERRRRPSPAVDPMLDRAANAQALMLLLEAREMKGMPPLQEQTRRLTEWLLKQAAPANGEPEPGPPLPLYELAWMAAALQQLLGHPAAIVSHETLETQLKKLLLYTARFHYDPASGGFSELPAAEGDPFTHPASNGLMARLVLQLPAALRPGWTWQLLPGLLRQVRWRPGIELDDLVPGVEGQELIGRRKPG